MFAAVMTATVSMDGARFWLVVTQLPHLILILCFRTGLRADTAQDVAARVNTAAVLLCGFFLAGFYFGGGDTAEGQLFFAAFVFVFNVPTYMDLVMTSRKGSCPYGHGGSRGAGKASAKTVPKGSSRALKPLSSIIQGVKAERLPTEDDDPELEGA
jgi:hypothetical protein